MKARGERAKDSGRSRMAVYVPPHLRARPADGQPESPQESAALTSASNGSTDNLPCEESIGRTPEEAPLRMSSEIEPSTETEGTNSLQSKSSSLSASGESALQTSSCAPAEPEEWEALESADVSQLMSKLSVSSPADSVSKSKTQAPAPRPPSQGVRVVKGRGATRFQSACSSSASSYDREEDGSELGSSPPSRQKEGKLFQAGVSARMGASSSISSSSPYGSSFSSYSAPCSPYASSSPFASSSSRAPSLDDEDQERCDHVLELYDIPPCDTEAIYEALKEFRDLGVRVQWVDDTRALAVCRTATAARDVLRAFSHPHMQMRPLADGSTKAREVYFKVPDYMVSSNTPRPATTTAVARRLISSALQMPSVLQITPEERRREEERAQRRKQRTDQKKDYWGD